MDDAESAQVNKWLACFRVKTNLRLKNDDGTRLKSAFGEAEVYLSNIKYEAGGTYLLDLKIVFLSLDVESAHERAKQIAEEYAFALSFVSGAAVRIDRPVYLIHWDPGVEMREQITYARHDLNEPLDAVDDATLASVEAVAATSGSKASAAKAAMRWYARSLSD